ncbi:FA83F protein, partial [Polypterus senegalus]|nr:FA83F protein [Polypterus senegalus]
MVSAGECNEQQDVQCISLSGKSEGVQKGQEMEHNWCKEGMLQGFVMAQSQVVCLEDNHVNEKIPETKPEFYYSEEQRIALDQLLQHGETGYLNSTKQDKIRHFVSAKEREKILQTFQKYDLDKEESPIQTKGSKKAKSESEAHSTYWPAQSDTKIPELDIGWPEALYYKGATRVTVHTHPPKDDGPHIKQVVRQMIQGAQKVVAIVMDEFTDIHILKDLVDASSKRKVPVYILLDMENVSSFIQTCRQLELSELQLRVSSLIRTWGMRCKSGPCLVQAGHIPGAPSTGMLPSCPCTVFTRVPHAHFFPKMSIRTSGACHTQGNGAHHTQGIR